MLIEDIRHLEITSPAFKNNGFIPKEYSCEGGENSPELRIGGLPETTMTMVLLVEDPDAGKKIFDHWVVFNIAPTSLIERNSIPGTVGNNSKQENNYHGPCPPSGIHHYHFKIFALNALLFLTDTATREDVVTAMQSHIVASGEIVGLFKKG